MRARSGWFIINKILAKIGHSHSDLIKEQQVANSGLFLSSQGRHSYNRLALLQNFRLRLHVEHIVSFRAEESNQPVVEQVGKPFTMA